MKHLINTTAMIVVTAVPAFAAGVERNNQSVAVLFEQGRYLEFGGTFGSPDVSGVGSPTSPTPGAASGDMTESYFSFGAAYKADLNDTWSYAIIFNQPYGADVAYPTGTGYFAQGSTATLDTNALTGIIQYNMPSNVSLYAGVRGQTLSAEATVPFVAGYSVVGERDLAFGWLAGAAYEKPELALRVSLTYNSEIEHSLDTEETSLAGSGPSTTDITAPQSLHLEFQSGVAEDTLVFGSVKWVDWTEFAIAPAIYTGALVGAPLVSYADDRTTFTLGVGRRLSDVWSVAASVSYEDHTGSLTGNLGPTDGQLGATLGATYTRGNMKLTGGVSYVDVGDARTNVGGAVGGIFEDNTAWGAGLKVGYTF